MKILVPTDFSGNAWQTLNYAIQLMKDRECSFTLIHTYEIPNSSSGEIISINDHLKAEANLKLKELKSKAEKVSDKNKHSFSFVALHGDFLRVINRFLQEEDVDLLAISMSNRCYPDSVPHKGYAKKIEALKIKDAPEFVVETSINNYSALEIIKRARRGKFSMIIMGAKGHSAFERFFLGSVTEKVISKDAKLPLLIVN